MLAQQARDAVNLRCLERLLERQRRQNAGESLCQNCLARMAENWI
jgi:hypothetical protein